MSEKVEQAFSEKSILYSKAFLVEKHELCIPPQVLACASDVFKNMFYGEYAEMQREVVPLPGKKYEEMAEFLRCLIANPVAKEICDENLASNLKLADEYQVESLMIKCEKYLRQKIDAHGKKQWRNDDTGYDDDILEMLQLTSQYNMDALLKEQLIPAAVKISLKSLEAAYSKQIKSNILLSILDLKLQEKIAEAVEIGVISIPAKEIDRKEN